MTAPLQSPQDVLTGLQQGLDLILHGNKVIVDTTLRTLRLAVTATAIGAAIGIPVGCVLGLGRSRVARVLLTLANGLARVPPVLVGLVVVLLLSQNSSPWGNGPLAWTGWYYTPPSGYLAQTLLAVPIVIVLTASAVTRVPVELLDQARAYGAGLPKLGVLALREARRGVLSAIVLAMGVTITAIGAIVVAGSGNEVSVPSGHGGFIPEPTTLAIGAFQAINEDEPGSAPARTAAILQYPTQALAVAYATVLLGLFVLLAVALTRLQRGRALWVPGLRS